MRCYAGAARRTKRLACYCLDASFLLARLIPSSITPAVSKYWDSIRPPDDLSAPLWLLAECTSVLSEASYRKDIAAEEARRLVEEIVAMPVRLIHPPTCYPRAFDIARSLGWKKAYDALYLAAAEHEGAELLTVDRGMRDAARRLGIRAALVQ